MLKKPIAFLVAFIAAFVAAYFVSRSRQQPATTAQPSSALGTQGGATQVNMETH